MAEQAVKGCGSYCCVRARWGKPEEGCCDSDVEDDFGETEEETAGGGERCGFDS